MVSPNGDETGWAGPSLSKLPTQFLEAYPFPAFVALSPSKVNAHRIPRPNPCSIPIVWTNTRWRRRLGTRSVLGLLNESRTRAMTSWMAGPVDKSLFMQFASPPSQYYWSQTRLYFNDPEDGEIEFTVVMTLPSLFSTQTVDEDASPVGSSVSIPGHDHTPALYDCTQSHFQPFNPPLRPPGEPPGTIPVDPGLPIEVNGFQAVKKKYGGRVSLNPPSSIAPAGLSPGGLPFDIKKLMYEHIDWSATPMGPMEKWDEGTLSQISTTLNSPNMSAMWVGREFTWVYNQYFANVMVPDNPELFGTYGAPAYEQLHKILGPLTEVVLRGQSLHLEDNVCIRRNKNDGTLSEVHCDQHFIPCRKANGDFHGVIMSSVDITTKVIDDRRGDILRSLTTCASTGRTMEDFATGVLKVLDANPKDAPFAIMYRVERKPIDPARPPTPHLNNTYDVELNLTYMGGVGVPAGHPAAPDLLSLKVLTKTVPTLSLPVDWNNTSAVRSPGHEQDSLPPTPTSLNYSTMNPPPKPCWPFAQALQTHRPVIVDECGPLIEGFPVRVWSELPEQAVVVPVTRDSDEGIPGAVIVIGISNRVQYDEWYRGFLDLLRSQLASFLVSVRSYQQDQELIQHLAEVDHAKNLLFANVANDLLIPMSMISGPLDDLVHELPPSATTHNLLGIARRSIRGLRGFVRMLVEVSSLGLGPGVMTFTRVNLGILTHDMASMFRKSIERKGIEYDIDCDLTNRDVYVDRDAWEKIIVTTIGMSSKYTRRGYIRVRLHYSNGMAVVVFANTSTGLPHRMVEHIGEQRYQSPHDEVPPGAVIHFALLKKLIDLHGGTLEVQSTAITESEGQSGVHVTICIPLGCVHLPQEDVQTNPSSSTHDMCLWEDWDDLSLEAPSMGERRSWGAEPSSLYLEASDVILLVDENVDSRRYMRSIFEPFCTVLEAGSVRDAIGVCQTRTPDLVIVELMMPYENGNVLLSALRHGTREMQLIPVIMLTPDETRPEQALAADDYLGRPFNARELLSRGNMQMQLGKRRRDLEERFEERTQEVRALMDESPMGIIRLAPDGATVTYANSSWYKQSGYPRISESLEVSLTDWPDYMAEECKEFVLAGWVQFQQDDTRKVHNVTGRWTNGTWMTVRIVKMYKAEDGPVVGFLGCCMDVSEQMLNQKLQQERVILAEERRREAEEAKAQQEMLIDITSHEIRNPISSLMQCSSLVKTNLCGLREDMMTAIKNRTPYIPTDQLLHTIQEDLDALDSIYECALTQERISNDVLSLGKIQLDLLQMFDTDANIRSEMQKIFNVFQNEARMNRIGMTLSFSDAFGDLGVSTVKMDPVRFGQIVTNLLANAIRFVTASEDRRIDLRMDVGSVAPQPGSCIKPHEPEKPVAITPDTPLYLYTEVADTGPGLPPEKLESLFQRFTQASAETHTVFGGSGLGLFVCRKITEMMGGRIEVASSTAGSVFRFYVKTKAVSTSMPSQQQPRISRAVSKVRRILIVEDNIINRTVLLRQLKHVGLKPEAVTNGLEAVERLRSMASDDRYDCVLMDLEMPVMDGYRATRLLREDEAGGRLPNSIIALTGNARQAQLDDRMIDFDEVVVKPYRLDDLLKRIEIVVKRRKDMLNGHLHVDVERVDV